MRDWHRKFLLLGLFFAVFAVLYVSGQQRFPRPEFESGYVYPEHQLPVQRGPMWEYFDVAILIITLSLATWLALKKRSRTGLLMLSLFSLLYFGFYRHGCICSVGSVQNVSLALFNNDYTIPLSALIFFILPLLFALFAGRVFCAGVCPLGAIQELTGFKPVRINRNVETVLAALPFVYLALAVLFSATKSQFLICRYDPFVGIFRIDAPSTMVIFGALLLIAGIFVNRPYCRFLCPYGVLLNIFSRFSAKHLTITPAECTNCRLCEESCPYDAILPSDAGAAEERPEKSRKRFYLYLILIPVIAAAGAFIAYKAAPALAHANSTVRLAAEIRDEISGKAEAVSKRAVTFKESGTAEKELFEEEKAITGRFMKGAPWAGMFLGASLGIGLFSSTIRRRREEYVPHKGKCFSCGKCFKYCPVPPLSNRNETI